jgi:hypothetical protein
MDWSGVLQGTGVAADGAGTGTTTVHTGLQLTIQER